MAVEHELLAFREQPRGKEIPSGSLPGVECESVGRIFGTLQMGFFLGCAEGTTLRLSLPVFLLLPPGCDKLFCSTMKDVEGTQY